MACCGKTLAGAARPHQLSEPPLSPPTLDKRIGTGLGRHLRGGMQIFVKTKNSQDQMRIGRQPSSPKKPTRPSVGSLPGKPPRHGKALPEDTRGATIRPMPTKPPPPHACSCQPNQLGRHLRGGMQIFVETHHCATLAACLPTWHRMHRWPGRVSKQGGAVTDGTGLTPSPIKRRGT